MLLDHQGVFNALLTSESVRVRYKDESFRVLARLPFLQRWLHQPTTWGSTVYFPSRDWVTTDYSRAWHMLCHAIVRIDDTRNSIWNVILYGMPQGLAVLSLTGLILHSWWPALWLLCLLPWPSPWRRDLQLRAYAVDMLVHVTMYHSGIPLVIKDEISYNIRTKHYWCWPFRESAARHVGVWSRRVLCGEMPREGDVYRRILHILQYHHPISEHRHR